MLRDMSALDDLAQARDQVVDALGHRARARVIGEVDQFSAPMLVHTEAIYFHEGRAKVEIAIAKGKREYDKRQALRERQDRREADRAMSSRRNLGD